MVVHNFHFEGVFALPAEAEAPLIVDADAVLASPVTFQCFQPVAGRSAQIVQAPRLVQQHQFPPRHLLDLRRQPPRCFIIEQSPGFRAGETANHLRQL